MIRSIPILLYTLATMDFSQFTGTEQAHMTKVIEKKQVGLLYGFPVRSGDEKRLWRVQIQLVGGDERIESRRDVKIRISRSCEHVSKWASREEIMDDLIQGEW